MRILLTGPTGQVGSALLDTLPALGEVVPLDRSELDLASPDSIRGAVRRLRPELIVNAAAYTAVDQAEKEEALAHGVNAGGPAVLAEEAARLGALLIHFSTDYVFDGEKAGPYLETDAPNPLNAYGRSKLAGERAIQQSGCRHLILRTSWVYSAGGKNFLLTMLRLTRERKVLRIVDDQWGAPTWARDIALATVELLRHSNSARYGPQGLYHFAAEGCTSWHGFAQRIFASPRLVSLGIEPPELVAIPSTAYRSPTVRPKNSRLNCARFTRQTGQRPTPWELSVDRCLTELSRVPEA